MSLRSLRDFPLRSLRLKAPLNTKNAKYFAKVAKDQAL